MNDATNPKIAAEKARDTYRKTARRKTTRKVGTGKAQRTDRKTASKVVAEKARGPYRQTAHPKTTRKVGVAKALSRGRKTASKVAAENARGTYRKTAARFEEFAYDGQIPELMHALAATSVAQTREFYVHSLEAVLGGWERFRRGRAISTTVSVLRRGWPGRKPWPRLWNCRQAIGASRWANWRLQAGEMRTLTTKATADVTAPSRHKAT